MIASRLLRTNSAQGLHRHGRLLDSPVLKQYASERLSPHIDRYQANSRHNHGLDQRLLSSQIEHSNCYLVQSLSSSNYQTSLGILMLQNFHQLLDLLASAHQEAGPTVTNSFSDVQVVTLHQNPVSPR